jgi:hypothetical protein
MALAMVALISVCEASSLELRRGVGVHEWLNWSPLAEDGSYRWPPYRSQDEWRAGVRPLSDWPGGNEFTRIHAMGFDFIRLSVDPGPLLASEGNRRTEALAVLATAIAQIVATDLKVVFDLHGVSQVPAYGMDLINGGPKSDGVLRYRRMVADVARMLTAAAPGRAALEPYNEPAYYPCGTGSSGAWQTIMADTVADIRAVSADLPIVVTGACGGSITGLTDLDPVFDDPNILYSFHMYEPHAFTHQRSDQPGAFLSGLPWPAGSGSYDQALSDLRRRMQVAGLDAAAQQASLAAVDAGFRQYFREGWGIAQMQARLDEATAWASSHAIPTERLFMGEFGAMLLSEDGRSGAENEDRLRYLATLRLLAEQRGIAWSIWEYSNPHGMSLIRTTGPALPDEALLRVLGLR